MQWAHLKLHFRVRISWIIFTSKKEKKKELRKFSEMRPRAVAELGPQKAGNFRMVRDQRFLPVVSHRCGQPIHPIHLS